MRNQRVNFFFFNNNKVQVIHQKVNWKIHVRDRMHSKLKKQEGRYYKNDVAQTN